MSWIHEPGGYHLLSNRDEKKTRRRALPPRELTRGGVRYLAPADGDHGGAWIAVNEFATAFCLLNGANAGGRADIEIAPRRSRGCLIPRIAGAAGVHAALRLIAGCELPEFAPFTLAILEPGLPAAVAEWDGSELALIPFGDPFAPLISSSVDPPTVRTHRARLYEGLHSQNVEEIRRYHASHAGGPSFRSPCMHREDAETVSFSHIHATLDGVTFRYADGPPCRGAAEATTCLR
ncbi:MAG: hypothetical protein K2X35_02545 [Bryobacteraceae bacterium]|nr:hypothetical protein [Bryobacteraceae bacterium]